MVPERRTVGRPQHVLSTWSLVAVERNYDSLNSPSTLGSTAATSVASPGTSSSRHPMLRLHPLVIHIPSSDQPVAGSPICTSMARS